MSPLLWCHSSTVCILRSSIGNPFADPLLRSVCSGISERLHRVEKQAGGEGEAGLMVMPEGVEEQLVLLGSRRWPSVTQCGYHL